MHRVSRKEGLAKIEEVLTAQGHCRCCAHRPSCPEKMRNYEIETLLRELTGDEHMVTELCPFNGIYCKWGTDQGLDPKGKDDA